MYIVIKIILYAKGVSIYMCIWVLFVIGRGLQCILGCSLWALYELVINFHGVDLKSVIYKGHFLVKVAIRVVNIELKHVVPPTLTCIACTTSC